ncbi:hypothetical protein SH584_04160 [Sphingomonas sp. LY29]|uniref:hypothetical protein n=1 Tax=Sphingomonas sp. LY29 TaxID=3095341 RepID=UPI002D794110|nr:hypothetical protein [Sphingomonas sp. LY29]WRP26635.1 hypothetical protein SH584_04160 [Sphingomonas sp. LY29]
MSSDINYYRQRVEHEQRLANEATDLAVRKAHSQMATLYEEMIELPASKAQLRIVEDR